MPRRRLSTLAEAGPTMVPWRLLELAPALVLVQALRLRPVAAAVEACDAWRGPAQLAVAHLGSRRMRRR